MTASPLSAPQRRAEALPRRAHPPRRNRLLLALALAFPALDAQAITLFWDSNLIVSGTGGAGTWAAKVANWAPTAAGISLVGASSNAVDWPNNRDARAVFAGRFGTVAISGSVTANTVDFRTDGYGLTGGTLFLTNDTGSAGGSIVVSAGVTATITSALDAPVAQGGRRINLDGPGTLVMSNPTRFTGALDVRSGTLRPRERDSLGGTFVDLSGPTSTLDVGSLSIVHVGGLSSSRALALGNAQLVITGAGEFGSSSRLLGTVTGSISSGVLVGGERPVGLTIGAQGPTRTTVNVGYLHYDPGTSFIRNADVTLTQTGSTGFSGRSSLFLEFSTSLTVDNGSILTLTGTPQLHNDAVLTVTGGSRLSVVRSPAGDEASLRVGYAGGTSRLNVSGLGTRVESADSLHLGFGDFAPNPGVGEVTVGGGATLVAPILSFAAQASSLVVTDGGTVVFNRFDSRSGRDRSGTIRLDGGAFQIGGDPQSSLATGASFFNGKLTGAAGTFTKVGPGDTVLTSSESDFAGAVVIQGGQLLVAPGALKNAVLTMAPGAVLTAPGVTVDAPLQIGAMSGRFDSALANMTVRLGGGDHTATWSGRFTSGTVGVTRIGGAGIQIIEGGTSTAPFTAPLVSTTGGTFRLSGGTFRLTNETLLILERVPLRADGATALIEITNGAQVTTGSGVQIDNGGSLRVAGIDTRLTVDRSSGFGLALIGWSGGGTMEVTDGASASGSDFILGNLAEPNADSAIRVSRGGHINVDVLHFLGAKAALAIDRGTVTTRVLFVSQPDAFAGIISLSDPIAASGVGALTAPAALTVTRQTGIRQAQTFTITDAASGPGSIAFVGTSFEQTLGGTLTYTGRTIIDGAGAKLNLVSPLASRELIARNGATMTFVDVGSTSPWDAGRANFRTDATSTIAFEGTRLEGGVLRGTGFQVNGPDVSTFDGTTLGINSRLTATGDVAWSNAVLQGRLDTFAGVTFDNMTISTSGAVNLRASATLTDVENNGLLDLRSGASVTVIGNLASGGGSRIVIGPDAALRGDGISLNGALLTNNGTLAAPLTINFFGMAKGAGAFGAVTVNDGGTFAPGNSPGIANTGSVVFNAGGRYEVEVADALGAPGTGFDLWDIDGTLALDAGITANSQFVISLVSLNASHAPGFALNFDKRHSFAWTVLRADAVTGFDPDELRLDTGGFMNDHDGSFGLTLANVGGRAELQIIYQPVPEPATNAMLVGGLAALAVWRRRRRHG
jgi:fibronectin-binding autotransporter adhesin